MFRKKKIQYFIMNFALFLVLLSESHLIGAPQTKTYAAVSDKQRKEIEKLRAELNENLKDEDDGATLASKGVIVQPSWTQSGSSQGTTDDNVKVEVTANAVNEVSALRAEINKAIAQDSYVGDVAKSDVEQAKELDKKYSTSSKARQQVVDEDELVTSNVDAAKSKSKSKLKPNTKTNTNTHTDVDTNDFEMLGGGGGVGVNDDIDNEGKRLGPNVIESNAFIDTDIDIQKLQNLEISKRREREILILSSIIENYNFNLGNDVIEWEHIVHGGEEYFIGRRQIDLIVVRKNATQYEMTNVIEVGQPITYLETYSFWNFEQRQQEGIIIIATGDEVLWYRVHNETGQIVLDWVWNVGRAISGLTYFISESNEYLAVSLNESSRMGFYALNIYQFQFHTKEFWIAQRMQLPYACGEVTILDTGRDIILAVAQNNTAYIYTFNPREDATDHIRFKLLRTIDTESIELIAGFQMGGRSYLALGGYQPQILLYQNGDFISKTILGSNFGLVELFFPIPAHTYRDDLILLVQHRVDFGTHNIIVLETLIWDGDAFEASIPVPCYFDENLIYGVSCMLDVQRDEGLKGAALLRNGDEISIIVPRHNAESGLFRLNIELLAKNSEFVDLQNIYTFLMDWVKEQDNLITQAQTFINISNAIELQEKAQANVDFSQLKELKTPELTFYGEIEDIYVNDYQWTDADAKADLNVIMQSIEELAKELDVGRYKRDVGTEQQFSLSYLDVDEAFINNLHVENVNNALFYIQNGTLDFNGILDIKSLEVLHKVNARKSRQAAEELIEINGDLEFIEINGINWEELKKQFVFQNEPLNLENLEVIGDVVFQDQLNISKLNSLQFPDDYLLSSGPTTSKIEAEKIFLGDLASNAIDTDGLINGVNPFDAITLNDPQEWTAVPTFSNLEVSEKFQLNGTTHGNGTENIPKNPTLKEATTIFATCNFKTLIVNGPVVLNGNATGITQVINASLLSDIVQRPINPVDEIIIPSKKIFEKIQLPIDFNVANDAINNITIDQFVTLHTKQILDMNIIQGFIYFNDLNITGLYDGVDIVELEKNSLKIDTPQISLNTQLNFVNDVNVTKMNVHENLNGIKIAEYQTINEDLIISKAEFQILKAKMAEVSKDIVGNATLNGLNLGEFLKRQSTDNLIATTADVGNIFLDELILDNALETDNIYGIQTKHLWNFLDQIDELPEMILDGKVQVDHVIVTGDVQLFKLNEQHFDEDIQLTAIWLNRPNYLSTNLTFLEPITLNNDLIVFGDYNNLKNLPALIDDMVFRYPNESISIIAPKSFTNKLNIVQNMEIVAINGIPFDAIATKSNTNHFNGNLQIKGKLITNELIIDEHLNTYKLSNLNRLIRYDNNLGTYVVLGDTKIITQQQLNDLTINGNLNEIPNLYKFFENLLYKNDICILTGNATFTGRITIEDGAQVQYLNGNNLMELINNIVLINELETVGLKSTVIFKTTIQTNIVRVKNSLNTTNLNGCSIGEWLRETIRVDQPRNFSHQLNFAINSLNGNSLNVNYINNIELSKLITLHTEQNITNNNLSFSTIYSNGAIETTTGLVNDVNLHEEYENTLLTFGDQHITTPLTFKTLNVLRDLQTNAPINKDRDLKEVATLNENLIFESPMFFQKITTQNVFTNAPISGINLTQWFDETLWLKNRPNQIITGNWEVRNLIVLPAETDDIAIKNVSSIADNEVLRKTRNDKTYKTLCKNLKKLSDEQNKRLLYIKYLEKSFTCDLKSLTNETIRKSFILQNNDINNNDDHNYLLINTGCFTYVYKWKTTKLSYDYLSSFVSGPIDEAALITNELNNKTTIKFLTHSAKNNKQQNCTTFIGLSMWQMLKKNNEIKILKNYETSANTMTICGNEIYTINKNELKEIPLYDYNEKRIKTWQLPNAINDTYNVHYRFIRQFNNNAKNVILSNGQQILQLNNSKILNITKNIVTSMKFEQEEIAILPNLQMTVSVLKPNATKSTELTFSDFRQIMERILSELIYRLQLEIDVTQLSIPETDLYDEHLIDDFIAIMQEIQIQEIFNKNTFAIFSENATIKLEMPDNVAQVLAARVVQIIWPTIVEIKEVHSYLRENVTQEHSICVCIMSSLGTMVRDLLLLSNINSNPTKNVTTQDHEQQLITVIERIREFQNDLEYFIAQLNDDIKAEFQLYTPIIINKEKIDNITNVKAMNNSNNNNNRNNIVNETLSNFNIFHLPDHNAAEILNFHVGNQKQPLLLYAIVTNTNTNARNAHGHVAAATVAHLDSIKLYMNFLTGPLFQTINGYQPHSLTTLRMRDETLLAFIENCCTLRVFIYRGVQGFVDFVHIKLNENILQLFAIKLLNADRNYVYYFVVVTKIKITFYQVIVAGRDYALPENLKFN